MLLDLDFYLFNHILSYCSAVDICTLLCVSKTVNISGIELQNVHVHGFFVYELAQFLRKHQIVSISYLKIEDYSMYNDHCLWWYSSNCQCIQYIIDTLESLRITSLELKHVRLDRQVSLHVERLYIIDCRLDHDIVNCITTLKMLIINSNYDYHHPDPLWNRQIVLDGLSLPCLEYFECNGFVFEDHLYKFIDNSQVIDSLRTFRIQSLLDDVNNYTSISTKITEKFRNTKIEVYL